MTPCVYFSRFNVSLTWSIVMQSHCAKKDHIQSFFGLYFPVFELNLCKRRKIRTSQTSNTDSFHVVSFMSMGIPNPILERELYIETLYLIGRKKSAKMTNFFPTIFFTDDYFTDDYFLPTNILTDIFLQTRTFSISWLKDTLSLSIRL